MFGKKKLPLAPYELQILTTEYLIDGTTEGDTQLYFSNLPMQLTAVKVQTTRPADLPARSYAQFSVVGNHIVAYIPRVEVSRLPQFSTWSLYKLPIMGTIYVGSYAIEGSLMGMQKDTFGGEHPMFDVHITSQISGTQWGELYAPFALVNMRWLQGYVSI